MLNEKEIYWITYFKELGEAQYNTAGGGYNSPFKYKSKEDIEKIVEKQKLTMSKKSKEELEEINHKKSHPKESNPNYDSSSNHKNVRIIFSDGSYKDFETRKELGEWIGYSNGNKPPMNKILKSSKFPNINGAIVIYT